MVIRLLIIALTALTLPLSTLALTWTETTHRDFSDGTFESHIYVSFRDGGTIEFANRFDLNNDGWIDIACPDMDGPNFTVYFGDSTGFSVTRCRRLPAASGGEYDIADLNLDSKAEVVHAAWHTSLGVIYWGSDSGPSKSDTSLFPTHTAEAITIADLDHDGWLDLIFPGEAPPIVTIYWGSEQEYSPTHSTEIYIGRALGHRTVIADINRDGYLDMTACCASDTTQQPIVYFGPNRTYRIEWLDYLGWHDWCGHGHTLADFNNDGWLDIVLSGFNGITSSYIYFGSPTGFTPQNRTIVNPGNSVGGTSAYDFDSDGDLDLIYYRGNGHLGGSPQLPIIYYNSGTAPYFSDLNTQEIGPYPVNSHGGMVADFNQDGYIDVFLEVTSMSSLVLWGPNWNSCDTLPCIEAHHGPQRDIGNVYDRSYKEEYISSVFDAGENTTWQRISWEDTAPGGSSITMAIRTGNTPEPDSFWSEWLAVENGSFIPESLSSRYIQYRAIFSYITPACLPMLYEVRIDYGPSAALDVGVQRVVTPTGTVDSGVVIVPEAIVRNYGTQPAQFPVTMLIGSDYSETESLSLDPGKIATVKFSSWTAHPVGTLPVVCFTSLSNDENHSNDTAKTSVAVQGEVLHDVGTIEILAPVGTIRTGDTVIPRASVRNFGTSTERYFNVRFRIGTVYDRIVTVNSSVEPNSAVQVSFPSWIATPGVYTVSCSTMLVIDAHPENDKLTRTITVGGTQHQDTLLIEWDQEDRLEIGERKSYSFYAELKSDSGGFVEIHPPQVPTNWSGVLFDSAGGKVLSDNNGNGIPDLGYVSPYRRYYFTLQVEAPQSLIGDTGALTTITFNLRGFLSRDSLVKDSAILKIKLVPKLSIHNFPNPFEDKTTFVIGLPEDGRITLTVYNRVGELLCRVTEKEFHSAGIHFIPWDGRNNRGRPVAPGTYHYLLEYEHKGKTDRIRKKLVRSGK
ncbi:MAG: FG-GAP-like repeat-containing protein [candidate division WOR-3 bacterium]